MCGTDPKASMVIDPDEGRVTLCWSCYEDRDDTAAGASIDDTGDEPEIDPEQRTGAPPATGQSALGDYA